MIILKRTTDPWRRSQASLVDPPKELIARCEVPRFLIKGPSEDRRPRVESCHRGDYQLRSTGDLHTRFAFSGQHPDHAGGAGADPDRGVGFSERCSHVDRFFGKGRCNLARQVTHNTVTVVSDRKPRTARAGPMRLSFEEQAPVDPAQ